MDERHEDELRDRFARLSREREALRTLDPTRRRAARIVEIEDEQVGLAKMLCLKL